MPLTYNKELQDKIAEVFSSQKKFAEKMGISTAYLSCIIHRQRNISDNKKKEFAIALECNPEEIFKP